MDLDVPNNTAKLGHCAELSVDPSLQSGRGLWTHAETFFFLRVLRYVTSSSAQGREQ